MNPTDLTPNALADIFGGAQQSPAQSAAFGGGLDMTADMFSTPTVLPDPAKTEEKVEETPKEEDKSTETDKLKEEADIFGEEGKKDEKTPDNPQEIKSLSDYYQERVKSGMFSGINDEDEDGNKVPFIPKTAEEFDEVIELEVSNKLEKAKKELENSWYESKTPAWKAIAQYADMVDHPSQVIPFIQGINNLETVSNLDVENPDHAEQIVRARMQQRGEPDEVIKTQIESLKTTDTLLSTAKQVHPLMLKQEQQMLAKQVQEAKLREQQYLQVVNEVRESAHKSIEQPLFGKQKLKQEEKAFVYDMIAVPSEENQGYGIYTAIDKLFDNKDFDTLKMVALLIGKKEAFFQYMGSNIANETAGKLQRKLTLANDMRSSSGKDFDISDKTPIQRTSFSKQPRFGK